jgi:hypothetical protein
MERCHAPSPASARRLAWSSWLLVLALHRPGRRRPPQASAWTGPSTWEVLRQRPGRNGARTCSRRAATPAGSRSRCRRGAGGRRRSRVGPLLGGEAEVAECGEFVVTPWARISAGAASSALAITATGPWVCSSVNNCSGWSPRRWEDRYILTLVPFLGPRSARVMAVLLAALVWATVGAGSTAQQHGRGGAGRRHAAHRTALWHERDRGSWTTVQQWHRERRSRRPAFCCGPGSRRTWPSSPGC